MAPWHPVRRRSVPQYDRAPSLSSSRRDANGWLAAVLGCALVLGAAVAAVGAASETFNPVTRDAAAGFFAAGMAIQIDEWRGLGTPSGGVTGAVFGDSVLAPLTSDNRFVTALEPALRQAGVDV